MHSLVMVASVGVIPTKLGQDSFSEHQSTDATTYVQSCGREGRCMDCRG
jgi:hypothetical protein